MRPTTAAGLMMLLSACGHHADGGSAPAPSNPPQFSLDDAHIAGTSWENIDGHCGYGLSFEPSAAMFHYFYACRSTPTIRNAMASYGTYQINNGVIQAIRNGVTCPSLASEKTLEMTTDGTSLTVKSVSNAVTLNRQPFAPGTTDGDQIVYGCFAANGQFTAHGWM